MPTTMGVYTAGETAGTEVSSTYEGRHLTVLETELIHPFRAGGFVNKGDPVIIALADIAGEHGDVGHAVGVALATATAQADYIAVDTEGIFNLDVCAFDDSGGVTGVVNPGDPLYISDDSAQAAAVDTAYNGVGDAVISKIKNRALQVPFGYALGQIDNGGHGVIAVKVHWDPSVPEERVGASGDEWVSGDVVSKRFREYHYEATGGGYPKGDYLGLTISTKPCVSAQALRRVLKWTANDEWITGYGCVGEFDLEIAAGVGIVNTTSVLFLTSHMEQTYGVNSFDASWIRIMEYETRPGYQINNLFSIHDADAGDYPYTTEESRLFSTCGSPSVSHTLRILVNGVPYWIMVTGTWA